MRSAPSLGPRTNTFVASGPSTVKKDQIAERGARLARRDDRKYREYVREEQRRQTGCPAHEVVLFHRGRATSVIRWLEKLASRSSEPQRLSQAHDRTSKPTTASTH
jgi:hypothetical protein